MDEVLDIEVPKLGGRSGGVGTHVNVLGSWIRSMVIVVGNGEPHRVEVVHPGRTKVTTEMVVDVGADRRGSH